MSDDLQKKIADAMRDPKNMGEMQAADAVGTAGSGECGDMLRMWIKFKEKDGRKVIDQATFQSFGCETAIAVASLATEMVRGKTVEEALAMSGMEFAAELGPLPPMKIHCTQLVEGALRSALHPQKSPSNPPPSPSKEGSSGNLIDSFQQPQVKGVRVVLLKPESEGQKQPE